MIKAILIINTQGKARVLHFFETSVRPEMQQGLVQKVFRAVSSRTEDMCNFVDKYKDWPTPDTRLVYRRYATLCFIFVVDSSESQLAILDLVQVLVETLDRVFENVCELDIVFHSDRVQHVLMELVMGGLVAETSRDEVVRAILEQDKLAEGKPVPGITSGGPVGYRH
jgi:AP-3 complex subunit sigma